LINELDNGIENGIVLQFSKQAEVMINNGRLIFIHLKRITRCKLALIFTSADHRKFLGLFGSEAARL
jgi:hypothetical protein